MRALTFSLIALITVGCGDSSSSPEPQSYTFSSRFNAESSVSYGGQSARHALIVALGQYLDSLSDTSPATITAGEIVDALNFFYDFKDAGGTPTEPFDPGLDTPLLQANFGDLNSLVSLRQKMPDVDLGSTAPVIGFANSDQLPHAIVQTLFSELEALLIARRTSIPQTPEGVQIAAVYVSPTGIDYKQLILKFVTGAVAFSQGTDDYLDDATPDKGLLSDNSLAVDGKPYTALEHAWDEGFGYFGAARNYGDYTDDEIAAKGGRPGWDKGYYDTNGDGKIDWKSEINLGHSVNAAKRDRGANAPTDFTRDAYTAFIAGRHLITQAAGALSAAQLETLKGHRNQAEQAWEKAIAATIVHYINDVLKDMEKFGTTDYSFESHAKHWSELKGFALILQFNPRSPLSSAQQTTLHGKIGAAPVLSDADAADITAYKAALVGARSLIGQAYGFDQANLGDATGNGGW